MSDSPRFPVLALGPDRYTGEAGNERFYLFEDEAAFGKALRGELRNGARLAMLLYDMAGTAFCIRSVAVRVHLTPWWMRLLMTVFNQSEAIVERVDHELAYTSVSFASIKTRVCTSIERNRQEWIDDDFRPDLPGRRLDPDALVANAKVAVRGATDVSDLFKRLRAAWPH